MTIFKALVLSLAFGGAVTGATSALATTLDVTKQTVGIFTGNGTSADDLGNNPVEGNWSSVVSYVNTTTGASVRAYAGPFWLKGKDQDSNAVSEFVAFCVTPFTWLNLGQSPTYEVNNQLFAQPVVQNLRALVNGAWDMIADTTTGTAFQLAVWEIVTETGATLNIDDGNYKVTAISGASAAIRDKANEWLKAIQDGDFLSNNGDLVLLDAQTKNGNTTQDLLTGDLPAPVPLPAGAVLLISGLMGLAALRRTRRA